MPLMVQVDSTMGVHLSMVTRTMEVYASPMVLLQDTMGVHFPW
jgi:hypothetical protein